jgi:hypothetical protein
MDVKCPYSGGKRIGGWQNLDLASAAAACRAETACVGFSCHTNKESQEHRCVLCNTNTDLEYAGAGVASYKFTHHEMAAAASPRQRGAAGAAVDGFYFTCEGAGADFTTDCVVEDGFVGTSVLALGAPLFDAGVLDDNSGTDPHDFERGARTTKAGAATVYVTLASSDLGVWNPFSWYPYVSPTKWAAIVTARSDVSDVEVLFDRGYGWVYLTSEPDFTTKSTIMTDLTAKIMNTATRRKLQARRLEASAPFWGCDDTLFECKPICLKKMGVTTTKVADSLCSAAPMDQCACKCFHEAQWTCEGSSVVCKAKFGHGELKTVGDKVFETRGAPKPASTAELRVDSSCTPVTEMRGSSPTAQCLAQWATPAPTDAPWAPEDLTLLDESFATTFALAALALYA